ncbi:ORF V: Enzymatic polyprotein [Labeo rohita]|uniref:ORF V: Enzymatic polyprotein n=1 Tax=Labeo rohita TaxID=84645 RepID=A0ABQ8L3R3_LABRO|nr:ORF V: Enzymatic polyprotein [Labeo rohita]
MVTAVPRIQSVPSPDGGSAPRDDLYSPECQWRPHRLDEPQRRIPIFPTLVGPEHGLVMKQEVDTLLRKEAIEGVRVLQPVLHPKKDGGLRPILDLRQLNRSVIRLKFRMLIISQVMSKITLGLATSNVIPFGLQYMRPLQWWLRTKGFSPRGNPQGPVLGVSCRHVTLVTDASLTIWGAVMSGHLAHGLWSGRHLMWHINCLEMLAVLRALKHFLPDLIGHHVLVHTDNTSMVYYIDHQGGLRSCPLYKLAHHILLWSQGKLLSLRAVHVPGHLNMGADILSRQGSRPGEWMLPPEVSSLVLSDSSSSTGAGCHEGSFCIQADRWIVDAITYESSGLPSPLGVKAHSTRGMAASKAFLAGVPMQNICNAAGWSTPLTFIRYYELDLRRLTQLEFLKGNVSGYVCNHGSLKGMRRCVSGHTSVIPVSACFFLEAEWRFQRSVVTHFDCIIHRPVFSLSKLQGAQQGSSMMMEHLKQDGTTHSSSDLLKMAV